MKKLLDVVILRVTFIYMSPKMIFSKSQMYLNSFYVFDLKRLSYSLLMTWVFIGSVIYANLASALDVTYSSVSLSPSTYVDGNRRSLNVRVCLQGLVVGDTIYTGKNCARAKVEKGPGKGPWRSIIFESRHFNAFNIVTRDRDGDNYKFWLRDRSSDDTGSFTSFLRKRSISEQAVVGAICKSIIEYGQKNADTFLADYEKRTTQSNREVLN